MGKKKRIMADLNDPLRTLIGNTWNKDLTSWGADPSLAGAGTDGYKYLSDLKYKGADSGNYAKGFKVDSKRTLGMKYITLSGDEGSKNLKMKYFKPAALMTPEDENWAIEELTINFQKLSGKYQSEMVMRHIELLLKQERDFLFDNWKTSFFDYSFVLDVPIQEEMIKKINMPLQPKYAKVTPMYNFYQKDYEDVDSSDPDFFKFNSHPEDFLYNLYILSLLEKLSFPNSEKLRKYRDGLKGGLYQLLHRDSFSFEYIKKQAGYKSSGGKPTFPFWKNYWEKIKSRIDTAKQGRYLLFSSTDTDLLKEFEDKKYLFPMGIELEFSSQEVEAFTNTLAKAKSMFPIMYKAGAAIQQNPPPTELYHTNAPHYERNKDKYELKSGAVQDEFLLTIPIKEFLEDYALMAATSLGTALKEQVTHITSGEEKIPTEGGTSFIEKLKAKILENKLEQVLIDKGAQPKTTVGQKYSGTNLSILDVFNGVPSSYEVMFFQIDKHKVLNGDEEMVPLQTIMIPNTEDVATHKYFDSQVLYGTDYTYKIYAWCLVIGTEYKYVGLDELKIDWQKPDVKYIFNDANLKVNVAYRPAPPRMIRVPYFKYGSQNSPIYVLDNPPTEPNVNVVPYKNEDSKVLITVDSGIGSYITEPVELIKNEFEGIKKYQKTFLHDISDNKVLFESDDPVTSFEVFRLTERPAAYEDFAGNSLRTIKADAGGFVDQIAPNTKYYYTVRSTDVHGLVSNPSAIYEVELINNSGTIYPKIRIVNLEQSEPPQKRVKSIKRFLKIEPTGEQIAVNPLKIPANAGSAKELNKGTLANLVGILDESVFSKDKKFKIRITSKHTKKKVDVNLKFSLAETNDT